MNSIVARATLISLFLVLTVVTQGHTEDYYIYQTANGDLVISNKQPPSGSIIIKQLPGETAPDQQPVKPLPNVQPGDSAKPTNDK